MEAIDSGYAHSLVTRMAKTKEEKAQVYQLRQLQNLSEQDYDLYSDHLIVLDETVNQVVGTYRLLPGKRVIDLGGLYSQSLFEFHHFTEHIPQVLEIGSGCVAAGYRDGKVTQKLWKGIRDYLNGTTYRYIVGCTSLPLMEIQEINELYSFLVYSGFVIDRYRIEPREEFRIQGLHLISPDKMVSHRIQRKLSASLKRCYWVGGKIASEPIMNPILQTIDFFVVLEVGKMIRHYRRK
ncbi:Putative hemolysin [Thermoactinomyces sp. DSM 45891]|uniref:GNAT family N-acetyltransferase n=1 Tax=Thermoactinomyces sp. DSM 45891 TaxID=1761907 RepID=UPI0009228CAA|nr:GNAT family N-acetyltransferase [Thermoactinomyces sp. DSM 45891]SFX49478.1 Putative hemolysin [Thermoactinomyces sp. DSM 45891]